MDALNQDEINEPLENEADAHVSNDLETRVAELEAKTAELENEITNIKESLSLLDLFNKNENGGLLFSSLEYSKLSDELKNNGKIYLIKD